MPGYVPALMLLSGFCRNIRHIAIPLNIIIRRIDHQLNIAIVFQMRNHDINMSTSSYVEKLNNGI